MSDIIGIDLIELIRTAGYLGLFIIVFLESGIPLGFFLPGDSLLFTAGILASADFFNIFLLAGLVSVAAILGDNAGYWLGARFGRKLFEKEKALFLSKKNLVRTEKFYEKYGVRAIVLARFVPVVRTFTPIFAGVAQMRYKTFLAYNVIGALLWGAGLTVIGFSLGSLIPNITDYLHYIVVFIIIVSALPVAFEVLRARKEASAS